MPGNRTQDTTYTGSGNAGGDYSGGSGEILIKAGVTITSESDTVQYAVCDERGATEDISKMNIIQCLGRPYIQAFDAGDSCSP